MSKLCKGMHYTCICQCCRVQTSNCEFYDEDPQLPIYERIASSRKQIYTTENIVQILFNPCLSSSGLLCSKVPCSVSHDVAFVVDTNKLDDKEDILSDNMGVWKNNLVDKGYVRVSVAEHKVTRVEKCGPPTSHSAPIHCKTCVPHPWN